jgi:hypothetical protein
MALPDPDEWEAGQLEARRIVLQELTTVIEILVLEECRIEAGTGRSIGERIDERLAKLWGST